MRHTTRLVDRGIRTVNGITVIITELVGPDGTRDFAVDLPDGTELTNGPFDTPPTDGELLNLLNESRGLWHCPSCHTTIATGEHDLIADHIRDCYDASQQ